MPWSNGDILHNGICIRLIVENILLLFFIYSLSDIMDSIASLSVFLYRVSLLRIPISLITREKFLRVVMESVTHIFTVTAIVAVGVVLLLIV